MRRTDGVEEWEGPIVRGPYKETYKKDQKSREDWTYKSSLI